MGGAGKAKLYPDPIFFIGFFGHGVLVVIEGFEARFSVGLRLRETPIGSARQLSDGYPFVRSTAHGELSITEFQVLGIRFQMIGRSLQKLLPNLFRRTNGSCGVMPVELVRIDSGGHDRWMACTVKGGGDPDLLDLQTELIGNDLG